MRFPPIAHWGEMTVSPLEDFFLVLLFGLFISLALSSTMLKVLKGSWRLYV